MVRVRNLVLAVAAASALTSGMAHALGLGEVNLQSSLNQPLVAEIELLDARGLGPGEVISSLASVEDFNKAGVDRQYFLSDLQFTAVQRSDGRQVIQVTSSKPVREPYLNFLVEVLWPSGRLLREYTLLLDPPLYSPEVVAQAAPQLPIAAPSATPVNRAPAQPAEARPARSAAAVAPAVPAAVPQAGEYRTTPRDTLWQVAERANQGGTVHQTMLAIQDLNPKAFIASNINQLKSGQVLRMPSADQVASRTQAEAIAEVARQNAAWREGRSSAASGARQLDATQRNAAGAAPARSESGDSLRLLAGDAGTDATGSERGGAGEAKALRDQLALSQENLDSSRRENAELKDRLQDLQSQLDKLQRLMALKDDQLAKMQAQLAAEGEAAPAEGASAVLADPASAGSADGIAMTPALDGENAAGAAGETPAPVPAEASSSVPTATAQPELSAEAPLAGEATEAGQPSEAAASSAQTEQPVAEAPARAEPQPVQVAPKPAQPAPEPAEEDVLAGLLGNPVLLAAAGGGVLLLLLLGLMIKSRRKAMDEAELEERLEADERAEFYTAVPGMAPAGPMDHEREDVGLAKRVEQHPGAETQAASVNALAEADIYIAYGRFTQAAELLQDALNQEPHRKDLRLKLMEVRAELNDRDGFLSDEAELREIGGADADIERLRARYPAMAAVALATAASVSAASEFDDLTFEELLLDEPDTQASQGEASQDFEGDFDLNLDDLEAQLSLDKPSAEPGGDDQALTLEDLEAQLAFEAPSEVSGDAFDLSGLDLDDELKLLDDEAQPAAMQAASTSDDFSFDLDLDLDLDLSDEPKAAAAASAELESFSDLTLDLDDERRPGPSVEDELALSLDEALRSGSEEQMDEEAEDSIAFSLDMPEDTLAEPKPLLLELPEDFELDLNEGGASAAELAAQLDEMDAELDALTRQFETQPQEAAPVQLQSVATGSSQAVAMANELGDDLDFLPDTDETSTKLDLAKAYVEMGDAEGARDILDEVLNEGSALQQQEARDMLARLA